MRIDVDVNEIYNEVFYNFSDFIDWVAYTLKRKGELHKLDNLSECIKITKEEYEKDMVKVV